MVHRFRRETNGVVVLHSSSIFSSRILSAIEDFNRAVTVKKLVGSVGRRGEVGVVWVWIARRDVVV